MTHTLDTGTAIFVCTQRMHPTGTEREVVHRKLLLVIHFYVVAGKVYKSREQGATLKIEVILSLQETQKVKFHKAKNIKDSN